MKRFVYILALVLVGVWAFPVAVFGQPDVENEQNDNLIEPSGPTVEQNNVDQEKGVEDQAQNDNDGDEQQNGSKECTEFIPYDERNPNLSPEEKQAIEQYRKYLKENFVCEEQGDHYQTWVSKDKVVVASYWTSNPFDAVFTWINGGFEQATPEIKHFVIERKKAPEPPGPPGFIKPGGPKNSGK